MWPTALFIHFYQEYNSWNSGGTRKKVLKKLDDTYFKRFGGNLYA